jgi:fructoselysine 6-kinase
MSIASAGDNVIDLYPSTGRGYPGGNAVNVAVAARRCGLRSAYIGVVGDDDAGRNLLRVLASEDVSTSRVRVRPGSTAWCEIQLLDGDREFVSHDLGVSQFELDAEDFAYLAGFSMLHTGDNSRLESQVAQIATVTRVSYDFGSRSPDYVRPLIGHVWFASFSASHLPPDAATALAGEMAALGPRAVLVSEGARGAQLVVDGQHYAVSSHAVAVTDSLGAGDALIGGVLSGLIRGDSPPQALLAGTKLAASVIGHFGAFGYGFDLASLPWPAGDDTGALGVDR